MRKKSCKRHRVLNRNGSIDSKAVAYNKKCARSTHDNTWMKKLKGKTVYDVYLKKLMQATQARS